MPSLGLEKGKRYRIIYRASARANARSLEMVARFLSAEDSGKTLFFEGRPLFGTIKIERHAMPVLHIIPVGDSTGIFGPRNWRP